MTLSSPSLSVVMPAFNERDNIELVVEQTVEELERRLEATEISDYQLVLVDDGSTDGTGELIDQLAKDNRRITALSHGTNKGLGPAVKTGFYAARLDLITFLPADGQIPVTEIDELLAAIRDGADVAVGFFVDRRAVDGWFRAVLSRGLREMVGLVLGVRDHRDGAYVFRRSLLSEMPLKSDTFFVNLELIYRARRRPSLRVVYEPIHVHPRRAGSSKVMGIRQVIQVGAEVLKLRAHFVAEAALRRFSA